MCRKVHLPSFMQVCLSIMYYFIQAARGLVGMVTLKLMRSDWATRHCVGFILIILSNNNFAFKSRHFKLSKDMCLMSVCFVFAEFQCILLARREREKKKCLHCMFSLFCKSTHFCCYCECTQKVDIKQIRLMFCSYLYDQN